MKSCTSILLSVDAVREPRARPLECPQGEGTTHVLDAACWNQAPVGHMAERLPAGLCRTSVRDSVSVAGVSSAGNFHIGRRLAIKPLKKISVRFKDVDDYLQIAPSKLPLTPAFYLGGEFDREFDCIHAITRLTDTQLRNIAGWKMPSSERLLKSKIFNNPLQSGTTE